MNKKEYSKEYYRRNRKRILKRTRRSKYSKGNTCVDCGKPIQNKSVRCKRCMIKGDKHYNWKGGQVKIGGRVHIYKQDNPMANKLGYVMRSRLVMSKIIGRPLTKDEVVHHINFNGKDDTSENLYLFKSRKEHTKYHKECIVLFLSALKGLKDTSEEEIFKVLKETLFL